MDDQPGTILLRQFSQKVQMIRFEHTVWFDEQATPSLNPRQQPFQLRLAEITEFHIQENHNIIATVSQRLSRKIVRIDRGKNRFDQFFCLAGQIGGLRNQAFKSKSLHDFFASHRTLLTESGFSNQTHEYGLRSKGDTQDLLSEWPRVFFSLKRNIDIQPIHRLSTVDGGEQDADTLLGTIQRQFFCFQCCK